MDRAAEEMARLDALFAGRSPFYMRCVGLYGKHMRQEIAAAIARAHGTTLEELDTEIYWSGFDARGIGTRVHTASLLSALGY